MCRKRNVQCCCMMCFGLGLMLGCWIDSWLLCGVGGFFMLVLGFYLLRR